jgi:D-alanyl-D-alanine carboxypeptidase (penicillin-binding protein 5/6)
MFKLLSIPLIALTLFSCKDNKTKQLETKLRWREEELSAKQAEFVKQEEATRKIQLKSEALLIEYQSKLAELNKTQKRLDEELKRTLETRKIVEIKELRGPLPTSYAQHILVINPENDEVIYEKNANQPCAIASTTKLLTALLIVEAGNLDQRITLNADDLNCSPNKIGFKENETYSRHELLHALLIKSSNESAHALARDHSGSISAFVEKMNARATELHCTNALFVNPHGLTTKKSEPQARCSAHDLYRIAKTCDQNSTIRDIVKLQQYTLTRSNNKKLELINTNRVLKSLNDCDGMKTGFTDQAGYCLIATGQRQNRRRIVIILNDTENNIWRDSEQFLSWALKA